MQSKIDAFEIWYYQRMLKISWKDKVKNQNVLQIMQTKLHFQRDMKKRKFEYAGHVLRESSGQMHLTILEGKVCGKRIRGRPRRTWFDDLIEWTEMENYGLIKRKAENRSDWRTMAANLFKENGKLID